jgi:hypothetical protein
MVKILERAIGWMRSLGAGGICYFCGVHEREILPELLHEDGDVLICTRCLHQPMAIYALDLRYWMKHPEQVPPCKHCGKVVPMESLEPAVCQDWYFCTACVSNPKILRWYRQLRGSMGKIE